MKVYLAYAQNPWQDDLVLIGVFSTEEKAQLELDLEKGYIATDIEEWEVQ